MRNQMISTESAWKDSLILSRVLLKMNDIYRVCINYEKLLIAYIFKVIQSTQIKHACQNIME